MSKMMVVLMCSLFAHSLWPQQAAATTAASGKVVDDSGNPVAALIRFIVQGAGPAGVFDVASAADGTFTPPALSGPAEVCIQLPGSAYVNPCQWPSVKLTVASASPQTALQLVVKKGAVATVRVNDATGVLAANSSAPLLVGVFTSGGLYYPANFINKDAAGRTYSFTIPYGVSVRLSIQSSYFALADSVGNALTSAGTNIPFLQNAGTAAPAPLVFSVRGKN